MQTYNLWACLGSAWSRVIMDMYPLRVAVVYFEASNDNSQVEVQECIKSFDSMSVLA